MLKKIFKHEFAATGKILWLVYGASFALSLLTSLIMCFCNTSSVLGSLVYSGALMLNIFALIAAFFGAFVMLAYRFTVSMAGKEAYFTYTLPAKNSSHLLARFYIAAIFALISAALFIVEIGLLIIANVVMAGGLGAVWSMFAAIDAGMFVSMFFLILLFCFVEMLLSILQVFAAVSLGTYFTKNRILGTIIALYVFSIITGIISVILMIPFAFLIAPILNAWGDFLSRFDAITAVSGTLWLVFLIYTIISALYGLAYYFYTHVTFSKKLRGTDS